jgi:hypothetical protein
MNKSQIMQSDWRDVKREIEAQIDRVWLEEPVEIQKIRWGIIDSGAGSGGQSFSVLVHLEAYLMLTGADILYRFLKVAKYPETELGTLVKMTREFVCGTFNTFEFLEDLGLNGMHPLGEKWAASMSSLKTKGEYIELTGAMMTYIVRMHRWVHFIFPWNLGVAFPQRTPAEVARFAPLVADGRHARRA